ncbi:MAG: hypothetical protein DWQ04_01625 [Chloroflexi bacterium]|nr:MAG: hypothetical protein DWQ04_01625 [Chloroflexota bacterium]
MKVIRWRLYLCQIGGMILFEMRRHWRRRGLILVSMMWVTGILFSGWALQLNASIAELGPPLSESLVAKRSIRTNGLLMGTAVYLELWSGTAAIALLVSGISVLVASNISSRRLALFLGLITAVCCFLAFIPGYIGYFQTINNAYAKQIMPEIIADFCDIDPTTCKEEAPLDDEDMIDLPIDLPTLGITLLRGSIALMIAGLSAWGWQKRQLEKR